MSLFFTTIKQSNKNKRCYWLINLYLWGMNTFRYIILTPERFVALDAGYKTGSKHHYRQRCHALLLSYTRPTIVEISRLLNRRQETIRAGMNAFEKSGLALWRKMKCEWLLPAHYESWAKNKSILSLKTLAQNVPYNSHPYKTAFIYSRLLTTF